MKIDVMYVPSEFYASYFYNEHLEGNTIRGLQFEPLPSSEDEFDDDPLGGDGPDD